MSARRAESAAIEYGPSSSSSSSSSAAAVDDICGSGDDSDVVSQGGEDHEELAAAAACSARAAAAVTSFADGSSSPRYCERIALRVRFSNSSSDLSSRSPSPPVALLFNGDDEGAAVLSGEADGGPYAGCRGGARGFATIGAHSSSIVLRGGPPSPGSSQLGASQPPHGFEPYELSTLAQPSSVTRGGAVAGGGAGGGGGGADGAVNLAS